MKNYAVHIPWVVVVTRVASNCSEWTYSECGSILPGIVYRYSTSSDAASRMVYSYVRHTGMYDVSYLVCAVCVSRYSTSPVSYGSANQLITKLRFDELQP